MEDIKMLFDDAEVTNEVAEETNEEKKEGPEDEVSEDETSDAM
mgnify:CR=1 FL=1